MREQKPVPFFELLSGYDPDDDMKTALSGTMVTSMSVVREKRSVELELVSPAPLPRELLRRAEEELARVYLAQSVQIRVLMADTRPEEDAFSLLSSRLKEEFPPAAGLLSGSVWEHEESRLTLRLKNGGCGLLSPYISFLEELAFTSLGLRVRVFFEDCQSPDQLLQYTETLRSEAMKNVPAPAAPKGKKRTDVKKTVLYGRVDKSDPVPMGSLTLESGTVSLRGLVFQAEHREIKKRGAWIICFDMTDYTGSVRVSRFLPAEEAKPLLEGIRTGVYLTVRGHVGFNRYENDLALEPLGIAAAEPVLRLDDAPVKRVELHAHTRMSSMDAVTDVGELVSAAARWGHRAVAVTDHGVAQAFPDAMKAGKENKIKILYGMEAYYINDVDDRLAVRGISDASFEDEIVAFDIETTGLDPRHEVITEIGAAVLRNGQITQRFRTFASPGRRLTPQIVELTGITDAMLRDAPSQEEALRAFLDFAAGRPLAAHNAEFDMSFITRGCRRAGIEFRPVCIDTLVLAQNLLPGLARHKLDVVASHLELPSFQHHRAEDDAAVVALMLIPFFRMLREKGASSLGEINRVISGLRTGGRQARSPRHLTILVKDQTGLRNLYKLISLSHLEHFKKVPIIPKSLLMECREGLLLGSACESGEVFSAVSAGKEREELLRLADFYDFLEIQPLCNNEFMLLTGRAGSREDLMEFNRTMLSLGEELDLPVAATGDVHFLEPEHEEYRRILLAAKQYGDADRPLPLYFRTTDEMLQEFSYLGEDKAFQVVVTNTNRIADLCGDVRPLPVGLFAPKLDGSREELETLVWERARALYGQTPPPQVTDRLGEEMRDIVGRGYDVIYMSAQKLVSKSLEDGYLVGSRGSVGSSLAAYMAGITEVNPLPPHYRCPKCRTSEFDVDPSFGCGADMPDRLCPVCGARFEKDGFSIPFATFLGFGGDKIPDIDLNFSGEYQAKAHRHTFRLFGEERVFRAGTIGTLKEKTAYGFVKKYLEERGKTVTRAEENRLTLGCVGVKRTTGQHPGGLVVIPRDREIYDFCPVQHPADDMGTDIVITHFEYHSMESNLLKLDMLGHDDPTMIRMLEDLTGVSARSIPLDDPETMSLYTSSVALGVENDPVLGPTGACAIPEFGTRFVREMLLDTMPGRFDTLVRIAGFSHGTDVWLGNARNIITSGAATVDQVIGARDDIMLYLISVGMPDRLSFQIMEAVRKGKGLKPEWEQEMRAHGVPAWYIDSCNKIKYLFPKAHAVAYVMMSFRIAWFKVHRPLAFYAAYFSIRAKAFDAAVMTGGIGPVLSKMKEIETSREPSAVEEDMLITLEVCYEFYLRGFHFLPVDLYRSHPIRFLIEENGLLPPFVSISGLGETAARSIAAERRGRTFISVEEFSAACPKVSKAHIEQLRSLGVLSDLPETSQMTLFD